MNTPINVDSIEVPDEETEEEITTDIVNTQQMQILLKHLSNLSDDENMNMTIEEALREQLNNPDLKIPELSEDEEAELIDAISKMMNIEPPEKKHRIKHFFTSAGRKIQVVTHHTAYTTRKAKNKVMNGFRNWINRHEGFRIMSGWVLAAFGFAALLAVFTLAYYAFLYAGAAAAVAIFGL